MAIININKQFLKIPWSKRAFSYYVLLLLNTFLYTLIFDEPRIQLMNLNHYNTALIITLAALFNLVLFFLLMLSKWVFIIVNPVLFYIGSVGALYADKFHLDTTEHSATKFLLHNTIIYFRKYNLYCFCNTYVFTRTCIWFYKVFLCKR